MPFDPLGQNRWNPMGFELTEVEETPVPYIPNLPGEPTNIMQLNADSQPAWVSQEEALNGIDYIQFDLTYGGVPAEGRLQWNLEDGTLEVGMPGGTVVGQLLQEQNIRATNDEGADIPDGTPVYVYDALGANPLIRVASNETFNESAVLGMTTELILDGQKGYVTTFGRVRGINTVGLPEGDTVWLGVDGAKLAIRPVAGTGMALMVGLGICLREHVDVGEIFINTYIVPRLAGLSDVYISGPLSEGDLLAWDSDNGRFEKRQATTTIPVVLTSFIDQNQRNLDQNIHGGLDPIVAAQPLDNVTPINVTIGMGKVVVVPKAGTDVDGTITVTGTSVDRNTGAETPADTDDLTVDALSTDGASTDAEGNTIHDLSGAYITSKWFTGAVAISTTDVDLTDVDIYVVAFEQFNDTENVTVQTLDSTFVPTNATAWVYMYLYSVVVTGDKVDITKISDVSLAAADSVADRFYRKRKGLLGVGIDGVTDGIFLEIFLGPSPQTYITQMTIKIWADLELPITLT